MDEQSLARGVAASDVGGLGRPTEARALQQGAKYTHSAQELERLGRLPGEGEAEQSQGGRLAERGDEQCVWYKMAAASPPPSSPPPGIWGPPDWKQTGRGILERVIVTLPSAGRTRPMGFQEEAQATSLVQSWGTTVEGER